MVDNGEPEESVPASKARLFDVRRVIGGLFIVYGLIVAIAGLFDSGAEIQKAQGVRINLWTGLAMLILGGLFLRGQPSKIPSECSYRRWGATEEPPVAAGRAAVETPGQQRVCVGYPTGPQQRV